MAFERLGQSFKYIKCLAPDVIGTKAGLWLLEPLALKIFNLCVWQNQSYIAEKKKSLEISSAGDGKTDVKRVKQGLEWLVMSESDYIMSHFGTPGNPQCLIFSAVTNDSTSLYSNKLVFHICSQFLYKPCIFERSLERNLSIKCLL